jgi:hypothetical protein
VPLVTIERQLGHCNLGVTSIYLQGIDIFRTPKWRIRAYPERGFPPLSESFQPGSPSGFGLTVQHRSSPFTAIYSFPSYVVFA